MQQHQLVLQIILLTVQHNYSTTTTTDANQPMTLEGTSASDKYKVQVSWTSNDVGAENIHSM
jgi:hypothetical protein